MDTPTDQQECEGWLAAGARHGFRVEAPYEVSAGGQTVRFVAFLPDFGGPSGMVIDVGLPWEVHLQRARLAKGLYHSLIAGPGCARDDRLLLDTLNDWGYYGPDDRRPAWYTGKPWN